MYRRANQYYESFVVCAEKCTEIKNLTLAKVVCRVEKL